MPAGPFYRLPVFPALAVEGPGMDGGNAMTDERNAPRQVLRAAVTELEDLRGRLLGMADRLELGEGDEGEDEPVQAGTVVRCVILDRLEPAIRDLAEAVSSIGEEGQGDDEEISTR